MLRQRPAFALSIGRRLSKLLERPQKTPGFDAPPRYEQPGHNVVTDGAARVSARRAPPRRDRRPVS